MYYLSNAFSIIYFFINLYKVGLPSPNILFNKINQFTTFKHFFYPEDTKYFLKILIFIIRKEFLLFIIYFIIFTDYIFS